MIFVLDVFTPLGIAVPMLYVIPTLLTWLVPGSRITAVMACCSLFLTVLGVALSPGEFTIADAADRAIASALLLVVAGLLVIHKQSAQQIAVIQQARDESEERLRLFINYAPAALAMFDRDMRYLALSQRWMTDYRTPIDVIGQSHYDVFPDIPERWKAAHRRGLAGDIVRVEEDRFVRATGAEQWLHWEVRPWRVNDDQVGGIVIFTEDITQRKRDEEELYRQRARLEDLAAKLLTAQETERRRLAQDLHDDITQRIAAVAIDLQSIRPVSPGSEASLVAHVHRSGKTAEQIATDLQHLAHQLHPSLLEHVGLEAAVQEHAEEFEGRTGLKMQVVVRNLPPALSLDRATCLYRVFQESLQNVRKHANATHVLVRLLGTKQGVGLCIHDDGRGFDVVQEVSRGRKGLGLISIQERVGALRGTFRIRAEPDNGTEVHVWLPFDQHEVLRNGGAGT
ncbi:MAG: PAS domain-containing sensor histidine kinase [Nitrospiraceae bacterium]